MTEENLSVSVPPKRRKSKLWIIVVLFLAAAIALGTYYYATADSRAYSHGLSLLRNKDYHGAIAVFQTIPDYEGVSEKILDAQYGIACDLLDKKQFSDAIAAFEALVPHRDSSSKILHGYYLWGMDAFEKEDYALAADCFSHSSNYLNSRQYQNQSIYNLGHALFTEKEYDQAQEYFDRLGSSITQYGYLHFIDLADASDYLDQAEASLQEEIEFYLAEPPEGVNDSDTLRSVLYNYIPFRVSSIGYDEDFNTFSFTLTYYPGSRILSAWESGDTSTLTADESAVLQKALDLVAQAQAESTSPLETEIWLHDWMCSNIIYRSPDMDVETEEYLKLRELTCIGAILDGYANCQGYADAFRLLGTLAGFEVRMLSGIAEEEHSWNAIYLDDTWYMVDVTGDDMESDHADARSYIWFNCAYDESMYTIDGGPSVLPDLATEYSSEWSYYGYSGSSFTDLSSAAANLVKQHRKQDGGWTFAMIEDMELDSSELSSALKTALRRAGVGYASWLEYVTCYDGNTYLTVYWN